MSGLVKLDRVNIIDLEATCYPGNNFPEGECQEIIEIGIVTISMESLEEVAGESILIKPTISQVSQYCTDLTGHTAQSLAGGVTYLKACQVLEEKYDSHNRLWLSQGNFDRVMFKLQSQHFGIPYPLGSNHMNIATLFSLLTMHRKHLGLVKQLKKMGMEMEGKHHSGVSDARNSARIFCRLMKQARFKLPQGGINEQKSKNESRQKASPGVSLALNLPDLSSESSLPQSSISPQDPEEKTQSSSWKTSLRAYLNTALDWALPMK